MTGSPLYMPPEKSKIFHWSAIHIGRKMWMCFVTLLLIVVGYVHCQIAGAQNYETFCWAVIAVLGVFSGTTVAQKFSPYGSSMGYGGYGGYMPGNMNSVYPSYTPATTNPQTPNTAIVNPVQK